MIPDIPSAVPWATTAGIAVLSAWYYWFSGGRTRKIEEDSLEERIKKLYQEENKKLSDKLSTLQEEVDVLKEQNIRISSEYKEVKKSNEQLIQIFQGRDEKTVEFQTRGFEAMMVAKETKDLLLLEIAKSDKIATNIERLFKLIEQHLANEAKSIQVSMTNNPSLT